MGKAVLHRLAVSLVLLGVAGFQSSSFAVGKVSTKVESTKKFGANVGLGDPFPGLLGLNGAYNITEDIRVTAGYAEVEVTTSLSFTENGVSTETVKAQTYAVGGQYLFTDWAFRPTAGLHAGYFSVSGKGEFSVSGFDKSTGYAYSNLGFDYIGQSGFHAATGMNLAFVGGTGAGFYANLGYFF